MPASEAMHESSMTTYMYVVYGLIVSDARDLVLSRDSVAIKLQSGPCKARVKPAQHTMHTRQEEQVVYSRTTLRQCEGSDGR
jgi:hypothetical protein